MLCPHISVHTGFHEGVADILSLAVGTATYFQKLGLLSPDLDISDEETNINILFNMALERIAFLPFGYLVDKYRWDVYSGVTSKAWIPSCCFRISLISILPHNVQASDY